MLDRHKVLVYFFRDFLERNYIHDTLLGQPSAERFWTLLFYFSERPPGGLTSKVKHPGWTEAGLLGVYS
jgi:hypothetical protein